MGRQIGFYFSDSDEKTFLSLKQLDRVVFLELGMLRAPLAIPYEGFHTSVTVPRRWQAAICSDQEFGRLRFIGGNGVFSIDDVVSAIIEFTRSYYSREEDTLMSGRLWYEHKYWDKDEQGRDVLREKSPELKKLYESLARWIRSHCKRLPNGNYIGEHAQKLLEAGARLSPP